MYLKVKRKINEKLKIYVETFANKKKVIIRKNEKYICLHNLFLNKKKLLTL